MKPLGTLSQHPGLSGPLRTGRWCQIWDAPEFPAELQQLLDASSCSHPEGGRGKGSLGTRAAPAPPRSAADVASAPRLGHAIKGLWIAIHLSIAPIAPSPGCAESPPALAPSRTLHPAPQPPEHLPPCAPHPCSRALGHPTHAHPTGRSRRPGRSWARGARGSRGSEGSRRWEIMGFRGAGLLVRVLRSRAPRPPASLVFFPNFLKRIGVPDAAVTMRGIR